ncbi:Protein F47B7.1 [Aphelenchoides avenae]|nr:Protein F47B7.1 [Aphelenchus avenae]
MAIEMQQIIELILAIILPPLAIFIHSGVCDIHIVISIVLCFLGYLPAIIHALWYCFFR